MRGSIRASAGGAATSYFMLLSFSVVPTVAATTPDVAGCLGATTPLVEPSHTLDPLPIAAPALEGMPAFVWTLDANLTAPAPASEDNDSPFTLPNNSLAVPLPPAVWTGFLGLAGLGAASLTKRMRGA